MTPSCSMWVFLLVTLAPSMDGAPRNPEPLPQPEERDESGFYTVADLGKLVTDTCDQLDGIKGTLDNPFVSGAAGGVLDQPLPFPNLAILDIFGLFEFLTKYFGMFQDYLNELMSGKKAAPPTPPELTYGDYGDESAPVKEQAKTGSLLMTPRDLINGVAYACKLLNLVGNVIQNPVTGKLSLPIPDPNHPQNATVSNAFFNPLGLVSVVEGLYNFVISPIVENTIMPLIDAMKSAIITGGHPPPTTTTPPTTEASGWFGWGKKR